MKFLGDVPSRRLLVECERCRRRGAYSLQTLKVRHGEISTLRTLLDAMRARCSVQPCSAQLLVPLQLDLDHTVMPTTYFDIDIWTAGGSKEMTIGRVWSQDIAVAAFDRAVALWPHSIITVRDRYKAVLTHNREEAEMRERQRQILKNLLPGLSRSKTGGS